MAASFLDTATASLYAPRSHAFTARAGPSAATFSIASDLVAGSTATTVTLGEGASISSDIDFNGDQDWYAVTLEAGYIYNFSLNGAGASPLDDPYLELLDASGTVLASDDDSGGGLNSRLTYFAATGGTYYVSAESYLHAAPATNSGGYTLSLGPKAAPVTDTVGQTAASAAHLPLNHVQAGTIDTPGDQDWFAVDLTAGNGYDFDIHGLGGLDVKLSLYDSAGNLIAQNDDFASSLDSHIDFEADASGHYYLGVAASDTSAYGSFTVTASDGARPLLTDSIDWGAKLNVAGGVVHVYFAANGETFDGETSLGWTASEQQAALAALGVFANVVNLTFVQTTSAAQADFKLVTVASLTGLGESTQAYMNPPGTSNAGVGVFARDGAGWDDLRPGGLGFTTLLHEFGHGLGLAHPFDAGGSSTVMTGVFDANDYSDYGVQNQGVYTIMSYNDGWRSGPPAMIGDWTYGADLLHGYEQTPMAIDIAALQGKYGANTSFHSGDDVYSLVPSGSTWGLSAIWDGGGIDTISAQALTSDPGSVVITLQAATMFYTGAGSGGDVSYLENVQSGFTIAQGVIIENAIGSVFNDVIYGNAVANHLSGLDGIDYLAGMDGNDVLSGGAGADALDGGAGVDTADYASAAGGVTVFLGGPQLNAGDAAGDSYVSIENVGGSAFADILGGDAGDNTIAGNGGNDWLFGSGGTDALQGGSGNDVLDGGAGGDALDGGAGIDVASYRNAAAGIRLDALSATGNLGDAAGDTLSNVENIWGTDFDDTIYGDDSGGQVYGFSGNDILAGRGGNDVMYGGTGADYISGGAGTDDFFYLSWSNHVNQYSTPEPYEGGDTITDFQHGVDHITVSRYWFGFGNIAGPAAGLTSADAGFVTAGSIATTAMPTFFWNAATGVLEFDPDGTGAAAKVVLATLAGATLTLSDIWTA